MGAEVRVEKRWRVELLKGATGWGRWVAGWWRTGGVGINGSNEKISSLVELELGSGKLCA
jgi:hypothetical protein